jgi:iron complex transport system substrate-binding protein
MTRRPRSGGRTVVTLVLVALTLLPAAACGRAGGSATPPDDAELIEQTGIADPLRIVPVATDPVAELPVTVQSADGREVTVTDTSRIVSLWGNITEVLYTLGIGDQLVGRDVATTFEEAIDLPVVTQSHDVSAESVLSLRPTLVFAQTDTGPPEALDAIRNAGVPVVVIEAPESIDDITPRVEAIASAVGLPAEGEALAARTHEEIAAVQETIPADVRHPRVAFLYMRGQAGVYLLAGPGSGADSMIAAAGGEDAGTAIGLENPFTPLTSEALVNAAPEVILMTTSGLDSVGGVDGMIKIAGVGQTPAGQTRRIVTVEDGLLYSFGSRTAVALSSLINQIYGITPAVPSS